ncbi:metallophosphoesterase [uncultured Hyphomonas sp.]|uniref:metallophosphoesterase family protein n=2 Tax=Hyphomonas TaxID=85 RepID=UPI0030DDCDF3|tara:strand:- start:11133 stop:11921 length:789 start_codon:yes stop_codon:yes gene_type:complete
MTVIAQISDIHFGAEDENAIEAAEACIKSTKPDMLVVCGDLTQRGRTREFDAAAEWLDRFDMPKLVVPGNHDTPMFNVAARAAEPFKRFKRRFNQQFEVVEAGGAIAVGINTARGWQARRNWAEGSVNLDDLDEAIVRAGKSRAEVKLIACHHPFHSLPGAPLRTRTRRGRRASDMVAASHVQMVLTGHVHTPSVVVRQRANGCYLAVSSGTLSVRLRAEPPSFNLIRLEEGELRIDRCDIHEDGPKISRMGAFDANLEACA